ncbi:U11/U12 small nuclear ribonucleoprotein 35 kDa protein-like [Babylonia areolata]|uniref:U11/U12 small nuclear ribonucleoprotein 35 kDa protein-like n=1 Tax=Babylonia areolata TaxID=304850 RepID=UPI003FD3020A
MEGFSPYLDKEYDPLLAGSIDGTDEYPHDRAIARALSAKYKPNKRVKGDPKLTLFVARLSPKTDEETLYTVFRQYGKIRQHRLVRDIVTGFSKCYGFVEFESEKSVRHAYLEGKNITIDEKEILVDYEHGRSLKNWIPRRLGGGFGGRKESGQLRFGGRDRPFRKPIMAAPLRQAADNENRAGPHENPRNYKSADRGWRETRERDFERSRRDRDGFRHEHRHRRHSRSPEYNRFVKSNDFTRK